MGTSDRNSKKDRSARRIPSPESPRQAPPAAALPADDASVDRWREFIFRFVLIVLAGLWIYAPSYHGDWLWDDDQAITANPTLQQPYSFFRTWVYPVKHAASEAGRAVLKKCGATLPEAPAPEAMHGADYFPLTATATWLQFQWFGVNPTGYHAVTILFHIAGALLLWRLLYEMKVPGAWLGGLLFAIHPVCVESVGWVSELKNTLSTPFFLLATIFYVRSEDVAEDSAEASSLYMLSILMFLFSMFAKTSVVMLPVVLLLHAWWKRGAITRRDILRSAPFFLVSLLLGLITVFFQHDRAIGAERILVADLFTESGWPSIRGWLSRLATAGMSILFYLWKTVWPFSLLPIYPRWEVDPPKVWQLLTWPIIGGGIWWLWKNKAPADQPNWQRHALFALGFFVLMLLPVLGFITISYMRITWVADHFIYLPMISIIALAAAGIATAYAKLSAAEKPLALAGGSVLLACLAYASFNYAFAWANEDALWTHTLKSNNNAWQAHNRLGAKKFSRGDVEGAHYHFQNSTRLRPDLGETHNNLGTTHSARSQMAAQRGDAATASREMALAVEQFEAACVATPYVPMIQVNLANALSAAGRFSEAAVKYKELLEKAPQNAALWNNYGVALYKCNDNETAIGAFRRALAIDPNLKDAKEGLAVATGEKPAPTAPANPGGQLQLSLPQSPTLGPSPILQQ
jgi:Flp pilus assembly protein TadD